MSLFNLDQFKLHSGGISEWKIDCDALTDDDLKALALMLAERLPPFGTVVGVPQGGLRIARALRPYITHGPVLIADDVLTTGASMEDMRRIVREPCIGAVIFARTTTVSDWIYPLFSMPSRVVRPYNSEDLNKTLENQRA